MNLKHYWYIIAIRTLAVQMRVIYKARFARTLNSQIYLYSLYTHQQSVLYNFVCSTSSTQIYSWPISRILQGGMTHTQSRRLPGIQENNTLLLASFVPEVNVDKVSTELVLHH